MEAAKEFMKSHGIRPRISFSDGAPHTVTLKDSKADTIPDPVKGNVEGLKVLVDEDGEEKEFFTGSIGLISKLAMCDAGSTVTIQMKKANNKSYFVVTKDGAEVLEDGEMSVIGDDESAPEQPGW